MLLLLTRLATVGISGFPNIDNEKLKVGSTAISLYAVLLWREPKYRMEYENILERFRVKEDESA